MKGKESRSGKAERYILDRVKRMERGRGKTHWWEISLASNIGNADSRPKTPSYFTGTFAIPSPLLL